MLQLTNNSIEYNNRKLYQVIANEDFSGIVKGTVGGWVESLENIKEGVWIGKNCKVFKDAIIGGGVFKNGTFYGGVFYGGKFNGGTFYGGVFGSGTFKNGTFYGGTFGGGKFNGGTFYGGVFGSGTFKGGTFYGGTFGGGKFNGGTFEGGEFEGGKFEDGTFYDGVFEGGVWNASPIIVSSKYKINWTGKKDRIAIGCKVMSVAEWKDKGLEIAKDEYFTAAQIEEYKRHFEYIVSFIPK